MNTNRRHECGRDATRTSGRQCHWYRTLLVAAVAISLTGCSGGSRDAEPGGRGTVIVTVKDGLGEPLAGAEVYVRTFWTDEDRQAVADSDGRAEFKDVIASTFAISVHGPDSYGFAPNTNLAANQVKQLEVIAQPTAEPAGGIVRAWVPAAGGVSDEGRTLEFSLEIAQVPNSDGEYWAWSTDAVQIVACTPDPGNDVPRFRPDCVSGADGFDVPYRGVAVSTENRFGNYSVGSAYSAALLLDQSANVVVDDPADARLFAAKYFLNFSGPGQVIALAAFASDDAESGQPALLPQKPVSIYPLEDLQSAVDGRSKFATVDSLAALEGGAAPLYAAIDQTLDFVATHRKGANNAVIVVTDGRDGTCGSRSECQAIRDAVIRKSKATGVSIVTVGLSDAAGTGDYETLGLLSQGAGHGAAFWARDPNQLAPILREVHSFLSDFKDTLEVKLRIQSPVVGAFASGRTVIGHVSLEVCPWDCIYTDVPFAVRVP